VVAVPVERLSGSKGGPDGPVSVRVLGAIELRSDDQPIELGGVKAKALLVRLLSTPNQPVPLDALWPETDQGKAEATLRSMVGRGELGGHRHPLLGLHAGAGGRSDRRPPRRRPSGQRPGPPGRVRSRGSGPDPGRGARPLAGPRPGPGQGRAVRPTRSPTAGGAAAQRHRDAYRGRSGHGPARGDDRSAGVPHRSELDQGTDLESAHAGAVSQRPRGRGAPGLRGTPHPPGP
jgi:hypothetical protein